MGEVPVSPTEKQDILSLDDLEKLIGPEKKSVNQDELAGQLLDRFSAVAVSRDVDYIKQAVNGQQPRQRQIDYNTRQQFLMQAIEENKDTSVSVKQRVVNTRTDELVRKYFAKLEAEEMPILQTVALFNEAIRFVDRRVKGDEGVLIFKDGNTSDELISRLDPQHRQMYEARVKESAAEVLEGAAIAYLEPDHYNPAALPVLLLSGRVEKAIGRLAELIRTLPPEHVEEYKRVLAATLAVQRRGGVIQFPLESYELYTRLVEMFPGGKIERLSYVYESLRGKTATELVLSALKPNS